MNSYPKAMFNPSSSSAPAHSDHSMHHAVSFSTALPTGPTEIPRGGGFFHGNGGLFSLPNAVANTRRVFSTGDLQGMNVLPPPPPPPLQFSGDNCSQEAGELFSEKVGRYSAEVRKERIERYRTKRHRRNFHKKITYACRKTLADSRPRVHGRFARNAETEAEAVAELEREASDNSYEYCPYSDLTAGSSNCYDHGQSQCRDTGNCTIYDDGKWWWGTAVAANNGQHQQKLGFVDVDDEDELWASLADMCSGT